ncbi:MAG: LysR family transcriptional regulator [Pseudomonadota bacterium]
MDLKQLATFREVVLTGSVSDAARKLGRTQPAISHLLSKLEAELGMSLFERRNGRLHPIPETQYLFRQASRILEDLEQTETTMKRMRDAQSGNLRIVSMPGPAIDFLPSLIATHLADRADVRVTLQSRSSEAVHRLVEAQQFDIGLADHMPDHAISTSARRRTFHFARVCAVPASHPLANKSKLSLKDLSGVPLATLFPEHSTTRDLRVKFEDEGLEFRPKFEGQFFLHLLPYVAGGFACALVDPIAQNSWVQSQVSAAAVRFIPIVPRMTFAVDLITPITETPSSLSTFFKERLVESLVTLEGQIGD